MLEPPLVIDPAILESVPVPALMVIPPGPVIVPMLVMPSVLVTVTVPVPDWLMPDIVSGAAVFVSSMLPLPLLLAAKLPIWLPTSLSVLPPTVWLEREGVTIGPVWVIAPAWVVRLMLDAVILAIFRLPESCLRVAVPFSEIVPPLWLKLLDALRDPVPVKVPPLC